LEPDFYGSRFSLNGILFGTLFLFFFFFFF